MNSWLQTTFEPLATGLPAQLANGVIPLVAAGVSLQVAFHGFSVIRGGGGSNHFLDVFAKAMRAFLVFAICLTGNAYVSNLRPIFVELQASLTQYVSGGTGGDINAELDGVMQAGISTFETVHKLLYDREHLSVEIGVGTKGIHLDGVPAIILQAIVSFFILAFGVYAFIDVQVISQSIVIVLAFGPLFLSGFAFEATAKWAEGWLTSAVKYVMTAIVLLVVVIAAKDQAVKFVGLLSGSADTPVLIPHAHMGNVGAPLYEAQGKLIAIMIVLSALLAKASTIAADMVGSLGIAGNAAGMFRSAQGMATGAMKGGVQGAMGGGGITGAMKGMALGAAGMQAPSGGGRKGGEGSGGSRPVNGTGGSGGTGGGGGRGRGGGSGTGPVTKSLASRAKQRLANTASYAMGSVAGKTIGRTQLPAMANQAKQGLSNVRQQARQGLTNARKGVSKAFRFSDSATEASVKSSNRAGPAFRDAWQRSKRP